MDEKIIINKKCYVIINKIDLHALMHVGQNQKAIWVLKCGEKNSYQIFIRLDLYWILFDSKGKELYKGNNFKEFLEETKQEGLWIE